MTRSKTGVKARAAASDRRHGRDTLTGLPFAAPALEQIARWQEEAAASGGRAAIQAMLLRLGNLPSVNRAHGAARGDAALAETAVRLLRFSACELGQRSIAARVAGDAFLVAAERAVSRERWQWLADELAELVARPVRIPTGEGGPDEGIALEPRLALTRMAPGEQPCALLARLLEACDPALHARRRPAHARWIDGPAAPAEHAGAGLEADLALALQRGAIGVAYQPQFASADGRVIGAEALARWQHPALGPIGPEALFAIAERGGHLAALSRHILSAGLAGARDWPADLHLSLNVTPADLSGGGFEAALGAALAASRFDPARLTLEITETALLGELERAARRLRALTATGLRIALDDFGAGFCNFRYLKALPVDQLKLDRSMVQGIAEDPRDLAVLRGIVAMASALDLAVTAEGIETPAQRAVVAREGCASWQGFLGAEPMPAEDFRAFLQRRAA